MKPIFKFNLKVAMSDDICELLSGLSCFKRTHFSIVDASWSHGAVVCNLQSTSLVLLDSLCDEIHLRLRMKDEDNTAAMFKAFNSSVAGHRFRRVKSIKFGPVHLDHSIQLEFLESFYELETVEMTFKTNANIVTPVHIQLPTESSEVKLSVTVKIHADHLEAVSVDVNCLFKEARGSIISSLDISTTRPLELVNSESLLEFKRLEYLFIRSDPSTGLADDICKTLKDKHVQIQLIRKVQVQEQLDDSDWDI